MCDTVTQTQKMKAITLVQNCQCLNGRLQLRKENLYAESSAGVLGARNPDNVCNKYKYKYKYKHKYKYKSNYKYKQTEIQTKIQVMARL